MIYLLIAIIICVPGVKLMLMAFKRKVTWPAFIFIVALMVAIITTLDKLISLV